MSCHSLYFCFTALYCTMNEWKKQKRTKKQVHFFSGFLVGWLVVFSSWDYFFGCFKTLNWLFYCHIRHKWGDTKSVWHGIVHQGWNKQLATNGVFCHGLVTKKTYSGIPNLVFNSHAILCALLPQVVFKVFSTNWNMIYSKISLIKSWYRRDVVT